MVENSSLKLEGAVETGQILKPVFTGKLHVDFMFEVDDIAVLSSIIRYITVANEAVEGLKSLIPITTSFTATMQQPQEKRGRGYSLRHENRRAQKLAASQELLERFPGLPQLAFEQEVQLDSIGVKVAGAKIQDARRKTKVRLSQTELGSLVERSQAHISDLENGLLDNESISLAVVIKLSHILNLEVEEILTDPHQLEAAKAMCVSLGVPLFKENASQTEENT